MERARVVAFPLSDRLRQLRSEDRGVTMVVASIWIMMLVGFGAYALDIARVYNEHSELQNAADAAVLAVAYDCAMALCVNGYDEFGVADDYADPNARDGAVWVEEAAVESAAQTVSVTTATEQPDGSNHFDMVFAQVLGYDGLTVRAEATASWGVLGGGPTFPLTFSKCEWDNFGTPGYIDEGAGGFLHRSSAVTSGQLPPSSGYAYESAYVTIYFHGSSTCHAGPSGQDLPGGFGWLDTNGVGCLANTTVGSWVTADPGSSPSNGCRASEVEQTVGTVVLIPYFENYSQTGNNGQYQPYAYGALYVTGYYFGGQFREKSLVDGQDPCSGNDRCIQGYMIGEWAVSGPTNGGSNLGVLGVQLSS